MRNRRSSKEEPNNIKKFFFWFVTYLVFISLFTLMLQNTNIYSAKLGFYLIMGFILVICSRAVYSAWHKRKFRLNGLLIWGLIYAVIFGLISYVLSLFPAVSVSPNYDLYLNIALFSIFFTISIMFVRRMKIDSGKSSRRMPWFRRAPSQILSGIILFASGLLVFRFSYQIFVGWFDWAEGMAWSWLIGLILLIAGFLTIVAWWRNNVSMFTTRHRIRWN